MPKGKSYMARLRRRERYLSDILGESRGAKNKNLAMVRAEHAATKWAVDTLEDLIARGVVKEPDERIDG